MKKSYDPFAEICSEINDLMGEDDTSVCLWNDENLSKPAFRLSTGSNLLDMVLGGGLPTGRVIEIFGWPGVGKTTMFSHLGASAQAQGGYFLDLDAEASVDKDRDARIGVQPDRYMYGRVESVEHGFSLINTFIDKIQEIPGKYKAMAKEAATKKDKEELQAKAKHAENVPIAIVWDTIAATPTASELKERYAGGLADKARSVREGLRKLTNKLADNNICLILGNHLTENIKGLPPETSCGNAIKFWASARLELKKMGKFLIREREVGIYVKVRIKKSKFSPQGYEIVFPLGFMDGIDRVYEAFDYLYASKCGVVTQKGAWYKINNYPEPGKEVSLYYADLKEVIAQDPQLLTFLLTKMKEVFYGLFEQAVMPRPAVVEDQDDSSEDPQEQCNT